MADLVHEHRVSGGVDVVQVHLQVVVGAVSGCARETTQRVSSRYSSKKQQGQTAQTVTSVEVWNIAADDTVDFGETCL